MNDFAVAFQRLSDNITRFIHGKDDVVRLALVCLFAGGHLLVEDVPGVAKTSLARAIANSVGGARLGRIQFTPDLLPSDVTGSSVFRQNVERFVFEPGPVFCHILLGDEINRASPRTQSALLEVMGERQVTVDGRSYGVDSPFMCIATQNPIEMQGTYPLPEAQIDRFMMMLRIGYPGRIDEEKVVAEGLRRHTPAALRPVLSLDELRRMIDRVRTVVVAPPLHRYIVEIARASRQDPGVDLGISPRGTVALAIAAQAHAACTGRTYTTAQDVKDVAVPVLRHRLRLRPGSLIGERSADDVIAAILARLPAPGADLVGPQR